MLIPNIKYLPDYSKVEVYTVKFIFALLLSLISSAGPTVTIGSLWSSFVPLSSGTTTNYFVRYNVKVP